MSEFQLVICYRLDRISRNTSDFVNTYEELKEHSVCFRSVSGNIDDTSPMGRTMMMISSVFAQLERDIIAERITDNMYELAKSGRWLGGNPPTGYRSAETVGSITVDCKIHKARMLEKNPEEAELVGLVFTIAIRLKIQTKSSHKTHKSQLLRLDFVNLKSWIAISLLNCVCTAHAMTLTAFTVLWRTTRPYRKRGGQ